MQNNIATNFKKYLTVKYILSFSFLNYIQSGISLLVSVLLARELGREDYGYFTYGMVFTNTLMTIMQFGTDKTLVRDLVQLDDPDLIISSATWLWLVVGILLVLPVVIWIYFISNLTAQASLIVLICSILGFVRGMSPIPWFDYKGKANYQSLILLIDRALFVFGTLAIIYYWNNAQAIVNIVILQLVARVLTIVIEFQFLATTAKLVIKPVWRAIKKIISDNIWIWLAALGNLLMTQVNQLMLNGKFGVKELALYGFAFQVIMVIRILQQQILRLVTPSIAIVTKNVQTKSKQIKRKLFQFCGLIAALTICIMLPAYYIIPYFIGHYVSKEFLPAIPILNVLYIWILVFGVAIIINQFLIGLRLQRLLFISTTVFGLLSLVLAEIFIKKYGALGAALSLLIAHSGSVIFQLVVVLRKVNKEKDVEAVI